MKCHAHGQRPHHRRPRRAPPRRRPSVSVRCPKDAKSPAPCPPTANAEHSSEADLRTRRRSRRSPRPGTGRASKVVAPATCASPRRATTHPPPAPTTGRSGTGRSEERRVGKERRLMGWHKTKKEL